MTAYACHDPITSMVTTPLRTFTPVPAPAPFIGPAAQSVTSAQPAPPMYLSTPLRHHGVAMPVPVVGADRQLQRLALGLLLTVLLLGIPLAIYLASLA